MAIKSEVIFYDDGGSAMPGPRANNSCMVFEYSQQCSVPYQRGGFAPSGSRLYEPFVIVKQIDKLTPLLWKAHTENAVLKKVELILYEISEATGSESPYFKYTLDEARISSVKNWMPSALNGESENVGHLEEIRMVARLYNWSHLTESTEHVDEGFFEAAQNFLK